VGFVADLDPVASRDGLGFLVQSYLQGQESRSPSASTLHANVAGMPPVLTRVVTNETLLDHSRGCGGATSAIWAGIFQFESNIVIPGTTPGASTEPGRSRTSTPSGPSSGYSGQPAPAGADGGL